jgi:hypothetical protein
MKTKIMNFFIFSISLLLGGCVNGSDLFNDTASLNTKVDANVNIDISSLVDTKWKLTGFVDVTGTIKQPETECANCYWIRFDTDSTLVGKSSVNDFFANYTIDFDLSSIQIKLARTKIYEPIDGELYIERLQAIRSFSITDKKLKLYYGEQGDYLLFEPWQESIADVKLSGTKWRLAGILNVETGELKTLEPYNIKTGNDCEDCYTLAFDTDTTALGRSCGNLIHATTKKTAAGFYIGNATEVYETGDCGLFLEVLMLVDDCFFEENQLIFAYTQDKVRYYLTYKRVES